MEVSRMSWFDRIFGKSEFVEATEEHLKSWERASDFYSGKYKPTDEEIEYLKRKQK
jgi:hypothetical protein